METKSTLSSEQEQKLRRAEEILWLNPHRRKMEDITYWPLEDREIKEAHDRLQRFAPWIAKAFLEAAKTGGIIESPLREIPHMKERLEKEEGQHFSGRLFLKMDSHLPISGSIKARGGVYEVLKHAETLATQKGMLKKEDDYSKLNSKAFMEFFNQYHIAVGSTGNLGLSIGIISARLGFRVTVHMSADAKEWKKAMLREKGAEVIEYASDYGEAVKKGRALSEADPMSHFIDDENSVDLFAGYAVAGKRLEAQLKEQHIPVDSDHPLFVYLPCGVGGGPGGVAYGLKRVFGEDVHFIFAEPVQSPCMLLGLATGLHDQISVRDYGLTNETAADGLAVARASSFVGKAIEQWIGGCSTVKDQRLFGWLWDIKETEDIKLEHSALAGFMPYIHLQKLKEAEAVREIKGFDQATHIIWGTGGSMVPAEEYQKYLALGAVE